MDVDEEYMRQAVELYQKEGMGAVRKQYPKCQHTMTIARYKKALEGSYGQRVHYRFLKNKIKSGLKEKKELGHKINRELAERVYEEIKDTCINGSKLKVAPRSLNKLVKEILDETPDGDVSFEEVDWIDINDQLEDDVHISCHVDEHVQLIAMDDNCTIDDNGVITITNPIVVPDPNLPNSATTVTGLAKLQQKLFSTPVVHTVLKWPKVLLIGDSVVQSSFSPMSNWGQLLSSDLIRIADVVNRGFVGYNTRWYKSIIKSVISEWPSNLISCVVLSFGMIDAASPECPSRQHVPYSEFKNNLSEMIKIINDHGVDTTKIILIGPPYFDKNQFKLYRKSMKNANLLIRKGSETLIYNRGVNQVAKSFNIEFIDLYNCLKEKKDANPLIDGLHLSQVGSTILYDKIKPIVMDKIKLFNNPNEGMIVGEPWQEIAKRCPKPRKKVAKNSNVEEIFEEEENE